MTRNNLTEHLTWLIASNPSNPPPPRLLNDSSLPPQNLPGNNHGEPLPETGIVRSAGCSNHGGSSGGEGESYLEQLLPSTSQVPVSLSDEAMVQLQSGSRSSNKSSLLSQPLCEPLQTPKAFQNLNSGTSRRGRYNASEEQSATGIMISLSNFYKPLLILQTFVALLKQSRERKPIFRIRLRLHPRLALQTSLL